MSLPNSMTAIAISAPGGPQVLVPEMRPVPQPKPGEILIRVHAAGVNRPDVLQRMGLYPVPPGASDLPGLEVAGVVAQGGARFSAGARVVALCNGGGYAEFVCVPEGQVLPLPENIDFARGAAIPETFFTVWHNVFERAFAGEGETLLVHGGSSGIGSTAIHLGKEFGLRVFVTAGDDTKCAYCVNQGADAAINYKAQDFVKEIDALTSGEGVDIVLDMVGGDYVPRNLQCLGVAGRHVSIAVQRGAAATINLFDIMRKRLTLTGSTLRPQSDAAKAAIAASLHDVVWPVLAAGRCLPHIHAEFPLANAAQAHALMESNAHMGKIVLRVID